MRGSSDEGRARVKISGREIEIEVSAWSGMFSASFAGDHFSAKTKDELVQKLKEAVRKTKVRIAVPMTLVGFRVRVIKPVGMYDRTRNFYEESRGDCLDVICTGKDVRNGRLLLKNAESGERVDVRYMRRELKLAKPLTPAQRDEYREIAKAFTVAAKKYDDWKEKYLISDADEYISQQAEEAAAADAEDDESEGNPRIAPANRRSRKRR